MEGHDLAERIRTVTQLADIVQALRTLASARVRQAQERFRGLERYADATREALAQALALLTEPAEPPDARRAGRRVVVLFSEHGFVGPLDERLLEVALERVKDTGAELVAVGARGKRLCEERRIAFADGGGMPTTAAGAGMTAQRLIDTLFAEIARGVLSTVDLVFAEHAAAGWSPRVLAVFPPEIQPARRPERVEPPMHALPARELVARAIEEYAFAQIGWAVAEAFASEHAARLFAMDAAHRHIDDKLAELRAEERASRQEAITNEILEIASGAEMLARHERGAR